MEKRRPQHGSAAVSTDQARAVGTGHKPSRRTGTSSHAFDDSEPVDVETEPAPAERGDASDGRPMSREENEAAELAEFEALERELAVDPGPAARAATSSFLPAAQKAAAKKSAVRVAAARASSSAGGQKVSAASTPPGAADDESDGSDGFAVEDHFGGASRTAGRGPPFACRRVRRREGLATTSRSMAELSAGYRRMTTSEADDDRVKPRTSKTDRARHLGRARLVKPGDGIRADQSLFYGTRGARERVGSRASIDGCG